MLIMQNLASARIKLDARLLDADMKKHLKKYMQKRSVLEISEKEVEEAKQKNPRTKEWNGNVVDEAFLRNEKKRERQMSYWERVNKDFKPKIDAKK